jgi:hypothetical protein
MKIPKAFIQSYKASIKKFQIFHEKLLSMLMKGLNALSFLWQTSKLSSKNSGLL